MTFSYFYNIIILYMFLVLQNRILVLLGTIKYKFSCFSCVFLVLRSRILRLSGAIKHRLPISYLFIILMLRLVCSTVIAQVYGCDPRTPAQQCAGGRGFDPRTLHTFILGMQIFAVVWAFILMYCFCFRSFEAKSIYY